MPITSENEKKLNWFKKWSPAIILSFALAIILIDTTLLNVALSTIIKDLNTDIQKIQWVITAYSLTLAALTITGGRLGDLFGRKKMFITGAIVFAIGSFLASISTNVGMMIAGESIIEGIGAAMMMPATASLLISTYKGRDRGIAFGLWGGVAAASSAIGPILGGWLTTNYSWRWGFRINVLVAAILIAGSYFIKEYRDTEEKPSLDLLGVLLSFVGILGVVFGVIESTTYGWVKAKEVFYIAGDPLNFGNYSISIVSIIVGIIFMALFMLWEKRVESVGNTPLVSLKLFKNRQFTAGMTTTTIMSLAQTGLIFSIPVFLQSVRGLDAFHTGLAFLPMSIMALMIAPTAGFLSHKFSSKRLVQVGLFFNILAFIVLRASINVEANVFDLIPGFLLLGTATGLIMAQINNVTLSAVSIEQSGEASGVNNTMRQLGSTLGTAVIGAVLITAIGNNMKTGISESQVIPAPVKSVVAENVASQSSSVEFGGEIKINQNIPQNIVLEIKNISQEAVTKANKTALGYSVFIAIIAFISSFWLPRGNEKTNQSVAVKVKK